VLDDLGVPAAITDGLLRALERRRIRAVGFVTWGNVRHASDLALLASWLDAGHELGNHSDRHLSLTRTDAEAWIADVERARVEIQSFLDSRGRRLRFFRFPFLREGDTAAKHEAVRAWLARTGQRNLTVTIDNQDWSYEEPWVTARRAGDGAALARLGEDYLAALRIMVRHHERNGDRMLGRPSPQVLLLHANEVGAANWDRLFTWLEETGHRFVAADELLADPVFDELPRAIGTHGYSLWDRMGVVRSEAEAREAVARLLDTQAGAWTRGDLEAFCSVYAEDAAFVTAKGVTRGRREVLERYRKRYPDAAAMGALTLEVLEMRPAWGTEVSVFGDAVPGRIQSLGVVARWTIRKPDEPDATGFTLLVLRPRGDGWEIVQDASM
jgi:peptidoglycan-N-acetylglucosamine deacetylase